MPLGFEQYYTPGTFEYDQGETDFSYEGLNTDDWTSTDWIDFTSTIGGWSGEDITWQPPSSWGDTMGGDNAPGTQTTNWQGSIGGLGEDYNTSSYQDMTGYDIAYMVGMFGYGNEGLAETFASDWEGYFGGYEWGSPGDPSSFGGMMTSLTSEMALAESSMWNLYESWQEGQISILEDILGQMHSDYESGIGDIEQDRLEQFSNIVAERKQQELKATGESAALANTALEQQLEGNASSTWQQFEFDQNQQLTDLGQQLELMQMSFQNEAEGIFGSWISDIMGGTFNLQMTTDLDEGDYQFDPWDEIEQEPYDECSYLICPPGEVIGHYADGTCECYAPDPWHPDADCPEGTSANPNSQYQPGSPQNPCNPDGTDGDTGSPVGGY